MVFTLNPSKTEVETYSETKNMNLTNKAEIRNYLKQIREHTLRIEALLDSDKPFSSEQIEILSMTFREFIARKLRDDHRIKGLPLFLSAVNYNIKHSGISTELSRYSTLGDVPMLVLIRQNRYALKKLRSVGDTSINLLQEILRGYDLETNLES